MIYDAKQGKLMDLFPERKLFSRERFRVALAGRRDHQDGANQALSRSRLLQPDPPNSRREGHEVAGTYGQRAGRVGFRVEENIRSTDKRTMTYWVDPQTKLPIRIEVEITSTDPMMAHSKSVLSDIVFDKDLDPALFSLDPPEGYSDAARQQKH